MIPKPYFKKKNYIREENLKTPENNLWEVNKLQKMPLQMLKWFGLSGKAIENICADFSKMLTEDT